jgi:multicomponent Na+:H+ antiporter subunit C
MIEQLAGSWNYIIVVILMMTGLFMVIARANLVKKMIGLSIFQTSVFIFYISLGKMAGGTAPILDGNPDTLYSNPLPHVLILTAIVVGVATTALGLALILRINEAFGSVEEDEIIAAKARQSLARPKRPTSKAAE